MVRSKTRNLVFSGLFVALMAVGANAASFLTIGGVPITLQLMFAILAGAVLGSRTGALAMLGYVFVGLAGAPVFAQFKGGIGHLLSPTFGFVLSFIAVAFVTGKLIGDRQTVKRSHYVGAGVLSILLNYLIGTNFMYFAFKLWADAPDGFSYAVAWSWMVAYLPIDIVVTAVSIAVATKLWRIGAARSSVSVGA
jgi:biotin transport system substrate-specific component